MKVADALFKCLTNQIVIMMAISEFELSKPTKDMLLKQSHETYDDLLDDAKTFDEDKEINNEN